jgi:quercetin dioxygenase-like cupin family protein
MRHMKHCALICLVFVAACASGLAADAPDADKKDARTIVTHPSDYQVVKQPWGELTWFVSRELKNSDALTVGKAVIKPGFESPRHYHPNCVEVLHVLKGKILHSIEGGKKVEMSEGDTITIPANIPHNAKNIGAEDAVMIVCFSTADRKAVNE